MKKKLLLIALAFIAIVSCDKANDNDSVAKSSLPGTVWLGTSQMIEEFYVYGQNMSIKGTERLHCNDTIQLEFKSSSTGIYYKIAYDSTCTYRRAARLEFNYSLKGNDIEIGLAGCSPGDSLNRSAVLSDENAMIFIEQGRRIPMKKVNGIQGRLATIYDKYQD